MYYYQTFVNAVRSIGGNNTNRWLVIQSVSDPTWMNALPTDTVSNRIMVEYHCYSPAQLAILSSDASWGIAQFFWGQAYHYAADPTRNCVAPEEGGIDAGFQQLADQYVSKGIPVMIGEFGAASKPVLRPQTPRSPPGILLPSIIGTSMSPNPPVVTDSVRFFGALPEVRSIGLRAQSMTPKRFPF